MFKEQRWLGTALCSVFLVGSSCLGTPVELRFSQARAERVEVAESGSRLILNIEFKAPTSQRPAVCRAMSRTDARLMLIRALSQYLEVPPDHELVLTGVQVEEGRLEGALYKTRAVVDRSCVSIVPKRVEHETAGVDAPAGPSRIESLSSAPVFPQGSPQLKQKVSDGLPQLSRDPAGLVISKELRDMAPKLPGLRSQALSEYTSRVPELFDSLTTHFPATIEISRYKEVLRACGEDMTELTNTLKREAASDLRLTKGEFTKVLDRIDAELLRAYEALEKMQPQ